MCFCRVDPTLSAVLARDALFKVGGTARFKVSHESSDVTSSVPAESLIPRSPMGATAYLTQDWMAAREPEHDWPMRRTWLSGVAGLSGF